jgi:hypothetical protein
MKAHEWRWAVAASALVMAVTCVPYAVAGLRPEAGWHFSGFLIALDDGNSYIGKMALGARGDWLFHLFYTTEPHAGLLAFWFHLLLGKLAVLIDRPGDPIALHDRLVNWYHGARLVCGIGLMVVSYRFCAEFLRLRWQRRLAFVLVALGGGLGWLLAAVSFPRLPLEFYSPEAFTFLDLYTLPHLAAARACLLLGLLAYLPASTARRGSPLSPGRWSSGLWPAARRGLAGGLMWLLLGFIQPLYLIVAYGVLAAHQAALWWLRRASPAAAITSGVMVGLSSPMAIYTALAFRGDAILAQWQRQNLILSPPPFDYLAAWGVWLVPAAIAVIQIIRRGRCAAGPRHLGRWLLLAWLGVAALLVYAPYNLQRRFAEGVHVPLVCLGVLGLTTGIRRRARRRWLAGVMMALSLPSTAMLILGGLTVAQRLAEPVFVPADKIAILRWLGTQAEPGSAVLASHQTGNELPAYAPVRAYLGHGPETAFHDRKAAEVDAFFGDQGNDGIRQALLAAAGIRYIVFDAPGGPARFDPAGAAYLELAYQAGPYMVYAVTLPEASAR